VPNSTTIGSLAEGNGRLSTALNALSKDPIINWIKKHHKNDIDIGITNFCHSCAGYLIGNFNNSFYSNSHFGCYR
jgi:hypothetical protein